MGYSTFGNANSTNGSSPFYKLKTIPLLNKTNSDNIKRFPVWRAAAANNTFQMGSGLTSWILANTNSSGVTSTIASLSTSSYLASTATVALLHLNTASQCLYLLLRNSASQLLLIRTDDTTGTTTAIGSAFTPSDLSKWPPNANDGVEGLMYVDGAGHMRVIYRGHYHQINITTGSIVTQNTPIVIGAYNTSWVNYLSLDGTIGISRFYPYPDTNGQETMFISGVVSSASGHTPLLKLSNYDIMTEGNYGSSGSTGMCMVDSDKVFLDAYAQSAHSGLRGYLYRADFDLMLQSVVDWVVS